MLDIPLLLLSAGWQPANARAADTAHNTQKYFSFIYSLFFDHSFQRAWLPSLSALRAICFGDFFSDPGNPLSAH